jgi:hypothetical protein
MVMNSDNKDGVLIPFFMKRQSAFCDTIPLKLSVFIRLNQEST